MAKVAFIKPKKSKEKEATPAMGAKKKGFREAGSGDKCFRPAP